MNRAISACIFGILAVILLSHYSFADSAIKKVDQTPKKGKNLTIKLFESMTLDTGEKKPADKKTTEKKPVKKAEPKKPVPKKVVPKKPVPKKVIPKKPVATKTKHDTAKNSISNVR